MSKKINVVIPSMVVKCEDCQKEMSVTEQKVFFFAGVPHTVCPDCFTNYVQCVSCGHMERELYTYDVRPLSGTAESDTEKVCSDCYHSKYVVCQDCYDDVHKDDTVKILGDTICKLCAEQNYVKCTDCGELVRRDDATTLDGRIICNDCLDENYTECTCCREITPNDEGSWTGRYNDDFVCRSCLNENYSVCNHCGRTHHNDNMEHDGNISVCNRCYDNYYYFCADCGALIGGDNANYHEDDDCHYCDRCYSKRIVIHDYYYKPQPNFLYTQKDINTATETNKDFFKTAFYGVELEIDGAGESHGNAQTVLEAAGSEDEQRIYCKHDGSLEEGFEIVTHPASIDYHMSSFPWQAICNKAKQMGYTSHKAGSCGLHIHISLAAFGSNFVEQDASIAKFLWLFERFWDNIFKFSRRDEGQLNHYAKRYGKQDKETADTLLNKAKRSGRFYAVNLQNRNTVEVRVFRGSLRETTIKASIQFCDLFRHIASTNSLHYVQRVTWAKVISLANKKGYTEFIEYCNSRNIK